MEFVRWSGGGGRLTLAYFKKWHRRPLGLQITLTKYFDELIAKSESNIWIKFSLKYRWLFFSLLN